MGLGFRLCLNLKAQYRKQPQPQPCKPKGYNINMDLGYEDAQDLDDTTGGGGGGLLPVDNIDNIHRICCVGTSKIGICSMVVMASHWPKKNFVIYDRDEDLIKRLNNAGDLPFFEPGLEQLVMQQRGQNLTFSNNLAEAMANAPVVFIAINIKTKTSGEGTKGHLDLTEWEMAVKDIMLEATEAKYIVEKSSFPADISNYVVDIMGVNPHGYLHSVLSNPEFFSQGTAIQDLHHPARVVIAPKSENGNVSLLRDLYHAGNQWVPLDRILIFDNFRSVDLGRAATNAILTMKIIISNICSELCDKIGANIGEVVNIITSDERIGEYVNPSIGVDGSGLQDIAYMAYMASCYNMQFAAKLLTNAIEFNKKRKENFVNIMLEKMINLRDKTVVVLGFSCKKNTDDIADSPALYLCERLCLKENARVRIYDPIVPQRVIENCFPRKLRNAGRLVVTNEIEQSWAQADALCFLLDYDVFTQNINFVDAYQAMNKPAFFFNFCNGNFPHPHIREAGFKIYVAGRPTI